MAKRTDLWKMWLDTSTAMNAAAATILIRSVRMQAALLAGDASGGPETRRMVEEKTRALGDGTIRLWSELPALAAAQWRAGAAVWQTALAASYAFSRPGLRTTRANAKRLSRRR